MKISTTIEIDGKTIFAISSDGENSFLWNSYSSTTAQEHTQALLELARLGYSISKHKIEIDAKRVNNFKGPICFG